MAYAGGYAGGYTDSVVPPPVVEAAGDRGGAWVTALLPPFRQREALTARFTGHARTSEEKINDQPTVVFATSAGIVERVSARARRSGIVSAAAAGRIHQTGRSRVRVAGLSPWDSVMEAEDQALLFESMESRR